VPITAQTAAAALSYTATITGKALAAAGVVLKTGIYQQRQKNHALCMPQQWKHQCPTSAASSPPSEPAENAWQADEDTSGRRSVDFASKQRGMLAAY